MTTPAFPERTAQTTSTTGTGTLTLGAAIPNHQALPAGLDTRLIDYLIEEAGGRWEVVKEGTYTAVGTTLTRGTFVASSSGAVLDLAAGTHTVRVGPIGARADGWVTKDRAQTITGQKTLNSPILVTPNIGVATGTSLNLGTGNVTAGKGVFVVTNPSNLTVAAWLRNEDFTNVGAGVAQDFSVYLNPVVTGRVSNFRDSGGLYSLRYSTFTGAALTEVMRISYLGLSVTGNLTVTGTANSIPSEVVIAPTLLNGWINFGAGHSTAGYWKDAGGVVHLKGYVQSGTLTNAIFTLPAGYVPANETHFPIISNAAIGECIITASGNVLAQSGSTLSFSLDGITFRAGV